jgi:hypothetical protein
MVLWINPRHDSNCSNLNFTLVTDAPFLYRNAVAWLNLIPPSCLNRLIFVVPSKKPVAFPNEHLELIITPAPHRSYDPILRLLSVGQDLRHIALAVGSVFWCLLGRPGVPDAFPRIPGAKLFLRDRDGLS